MTRKKELESGSIPPLLKSETELLKPTTISKARGKISRTDSGWRGLGMSSITDIHQRLSRKITNILECKYPYLYVEKSIAMRDSKKEPKNPDQKSSFYVVFDISVCQRPDRSDRNPINFLNSEEATDFLVGIELEEHQGKAEMMKKR